MKMILIATGERRTILKENDTVDADNAKKNHTTVFTAQDGTMRSTISLALDDTEIKRLEIFASVIDRDDDILNQRV